MKLRPNPKITSPQSRPELLPKFYPSKGSSAKFDWLENNSILKISSVQINLLLFTNLLLPENYPKLKNMKNSFRIGPKLRLMGIWMLFRSIETPLQLVIKLLNEV